MSVKRNRPEQETMALEMTPMIDVVFQLLIFFLVAFKENDILSHLDINRPADHTERIDKPPLLEILIDGDGFIMQGSRVSLEEAGRQLGRYSELSKTISLVIKCQADSKHSNLVKLLNECAIYKLNNINVLSM